MYSISILCARDLLKFKSKLNCDVQNVNCRVRQLRKYFFFTLHGMEKNVQNHFWFLLLNKARLFEIFQKTLLLWRNVEIDEKFTLNLHSHSRLNYVSKCSESVHLSHNWLNTTVRRLINHRHDFYSAEKWRNRAKRLTFMLHYGEREKNTEIGFKW